MSNCSLIKTNQIINLNSFSFSLILLYIFQKVKLLIIVYATLKIFFIQRKYQEQRKEKGIIKLEETLGTI